MVFEANRSASYVLKTLMFCICLMVIFCLLGGGIAEAQVWKGPSESDGDAKSESMREEENKSYALQAGRFRVEDEAFALRDELNQYGYEAYVFEHTTDDDGQWYAVRLGIHQGRKAALAAAVAFSKKMNMPGYIALSGSTVPVDVRQTVFFVQVGAFKLSSSLDEAFEAYKDFNPVAVELYDEKGVSWHVLHVGVYSDFSEALQRSRDFDKRMGRKSYVSKIDRGTLENRQLQAIRTKAGNPESQNTTQPQEQPMPASEKNESAQPAPVSETAQEKAVWASKSLTKKRLEPDTEERPENVGKDIATPEPEAQQKEKPAEEESAGSP